MLTLQILNIDASLNSFLLSNSFVFVGGEDIDIFMRLFQPDELIRFIPDASAVIKFDFKKSDDSIITKTASNPFADDRSIIKVSLTALETVDIIGQDLIGKIDVSSKITIASLQKGLSKTVLGQGC